MLEDFGFDGGLELRSRTHCGGGGGRDDRAVRESEAICKDSFGMKMVKWLVIFCDECQLSKLAATEVSDPVQPTSQLTPLE
jgi:hypothetical protein